MFSLFFPLFTGSIEFVADFEVWEPSKSDLRPKSRFGMNAKINKHERKTEKERHTTLHGNGTMKQSCVYLSLFLFNES